MLRHYKETLASLAGRAQARPLHKEKRGNVEGGCVTWGLEVPTS